jgi:hypothetical protein
MSCGPAGSRGVCDDGRMRSLLVALLAVAALAAGTGAAMGGVAAKKPPAAGRTHTAAGTAAATRMLLTKRDLGTGWTATPAGKTPPALTCAGFAPSTDRVVETGVAASPAFRGGDAGPFVGESVYVYATPAQARRFWLRVVGAGVRSCLTQSVVQGSTTDVKFAVKRIHDLALPALGARRAGYRLTATATAPGQTVDAYVDLLLIGDGEAIAAISLSSFSQPVSERVELALARAAARRLAAG